MQDKPTYEELEQRVKELEQDAVQHKHTEKKLRERESLLAAFTNALPDISFISDEDGKYLKILTSQDDLLAKPFEEMQGRYVHEILPKESADEFLSVIRNTIETNKPQVHEYKLGVLAGEKWFQARTSPMKEKIEGKNAVVWLTHDITKHKKAE